MRRVLRYDIVVDDSEHLVGDGKVLMVTSRRGMPYQLGNQQLRRVEVWVEVDVPDNWPKSSEHFKRVQVFGTGHQIPEGAEWVGSCLDGDFVWHVYNVNRVERLGPRRF